MADECAGKPGVLTHAKCWGSSPVSEPVMYQFGLKPLLQASPMKTLGMREDGAEGGNGRTGV